MKWTVGFIDRYLLGKADEEVQKLKGKGERILCLWDGSVVEKAESEKLEGLCPVLSSKAKRRQRTKRGVIFNWPAPRAVRVMGMQWSAALIAGMSGLPHLAVTNWWTTKGVFATKLRDTEEELLRITVRKWGPLLVHVFDRGYASGYWLQVLRKYRARFVIRWVKNHLFLLTSGAEKKLWQIGQGKRYLAHKEIRDPMTGEKMPCDLWWTEVRHPSSEEPLYLVRARIKKGIMYLVTNDPVKTEAQAWEVFFTYRRRWQIELCFRYNKCELALECPRLWSLEARLKLLGMVMLVYAFLLSLLDPVHHGLVEALLRFKCHRTGKRCQSAQAPLYRLRWALSRLWDDYRPRLTLFIPPSDDPLAAFSLISERERIAQTWG
ncbi:MAG: transposase [Ktedonobacteraceae bacterium]